MLSSVSARVRSLGIALAMCAFSGFGEHPFPAGGLRGNERAGQCKGHHGESDALRAELLNSLKEMLSIADSRLLIKTDNLLVWWFQ